MDDEADDRGASADTRVLDTDLLLESLGVAVDNNPYIVEDFYDELFGIRPEWKRLFRIHTFPSGEQGLSPRQINQVTATLQAGLQHANDHDWLRAQLGALGQWHQRYKAIRPDWYPIVCRAFTHTLAAAMGTEWWKRSRSQWIFLFDRLEYYMLSGYEDKKEKSLPVASTEGTDPSVAPVPGTAQQPPPEQTRQASQAGTTGTRWRIRWPPSRN